MSKIQSLGDSLLDKSQEMITNIIPVAIDFLTALAVLIIGYIISNFASKLIYRFLLKSKFDDLVDKLNLNEIFGPDLKIQASKGISKIVFWVLFVVFFMSAAEIIGWEMMTDMVNDILGLLPGIFAAIIIFSVGTYIATIIKDVIKTTLKSMGMSTGSIIANAVFYFIIIIVSITALDQAGMDTSLISNNLVMIIGAILVAGSISYGFASKDIMKNVLSTFFAKKSFKLGQQVKIGNSIGTIIDMSSISITLLNGTEKTVIPTTNFVSDNVIILKDIEDDE